MTWSLDQSQRVHFVGIAGAGMSGLAHYLLVRGYEVSGSDRLPDTVGTTLRSLGVRVHSGHHADFVQGANLVVISSAVPDDNPEVAQARARGIPVIKRAELLGALMNPHCGIAVAGTHGKSTTSAMVAHLLTVAHRDPTVLIGAVSQSLGSNSRVGESDLVVVEADEYDESFRHLRPSVGVVLNVEAEHLDFYGTEAAMMAAFRRFVQNVNDVLVICSDDPGATDVARSSRVPLITYGFSTGDWRAQDVREGLAGTEFMAVCGPECIVIRSQLSGRHNVLNALAAIAVAWHFAVPADTVAEGMASFLGVHRRLELRGDAGGAVIIDDYAHHPTEMAVSLEALRQRYPNRCLRLVFQPHTYSRTRAFFQEFAQAFCSADQTYLMDIYAARETDQLGMHSRNLAAASEQQGASILYTGTQSETLKAVRRDLRPRDVVVTMGAGDVFRVADDLLTMKGVMA